MIRVQGNNNVKPIECVNPMRNKWRIHWDIQISTNEGGAQEASYMEHEFTHRPTIEEVKNIITAYYNHITDQKILTGFSFQGNAVWLSNENQFNYKVAYDLAVQSDGKTLPVTFKFGTDDEPCYHTFNTIEELTDFYTKAMQHIQDTLADGWKSKDNFNLELYVMHVGAWWCKGSVEI